MPKLDGARDEEIQRIGRLGFSTRNVILDICRIELGPTRRDPRALLPSDANEGNEPGERVRINTACSSRSDRRYENGKSALKGASATGGSSVTRRTCPITGARVTAERQPPGVMPRSTTFDFGVSVLARMAHANRAYATSTFEVGFGDGAYAHNQRRDHQSRRCTLKNGLPAKSSAAHGVHG